MVFNVESGSLRVKPKFTYTGAYELIDDGYGNWRLKLLTSGTLRFLSRRGITRNIDVFVVGGGGGAQACIIDYLGDRYGDRQGYGGYYATSHNVPITVGADYPAVIGQGGAGGQVADKSVLHGVNGTNTSAFSLVVGGGPGSGASSGPAATTEFEDTPGTSYSGVGGTVANTGRGGASRGSTGTGISGSTGVVVIRNCRRS